MEKEINPFTAMALLGLAPILVFSLLYAVDWFIGWLKGENE